MVTRVPDRMDFPAEEEKVMRLWKELDAFRTSLRQFKDRPRYTFYDGPPFATGLLHDGHILAGTIKVRVEGRVGRERKKNMLRRKRRRWYDFGMVKA